MTLTTRVRIVEPTSVKPVFDECRRLLNGQDVPYEHGIERWSTLEPKNLSYRNQAGMGLHALLWVTYGPDGPLSEYDEDADYPPPPQPKASIEVAFDTTYGYRGDRGGSCGDLHAWLVIQIGRWLNERGLTWFWENEYTGVWYPQSTSPDGVLGNAEKGALLESDPIT